MESCRKGKNFQNKGKEIDNRQRNGSGSLKNVPRMVASDDRTTTGDKGGEAQVVYDRTDTTAPAAHGITAMTTDQVHTDIAEQPSNFQSN